jgi:hypothetical protein
VIKTLPSGLLIVEEEKPPAPEPKAPDGMKCSFCEIHLTQQLACW